MSGSRLHLQSCLEVVEGSLLSQQYGPRSSPAILARFCVIVVRRGVIDATQKETWTPRSNQQGHGTFERCVEMHA